MTTALAKLQIAMAYVENIPTVWSAGKRLHDNKLLGQGWVYPNRALVVAARIKRIEMGSMFAVQRALFPQQRGQRSMMLHLLEARPLPSSEISRLEKLLLGAAQY